VFQGEAAQETVEFSSLGPEACRLQFRVSVTLICHMKLMISWYQNRCLFSARMSTFGTVAARRVLFLRHVHAGMYMGSRGCRSLQPLDTAGFLAYSPILGRSGPNKDRNATLYRAMAPDQLPRGSATCGTCLSRGSFSRSHARLRHPDLYLDELRDAVFPFFLSCVSRPC